MPWGLKRYQQTRQLHFVTFSCYHRKPLLGDAQVRDTFVRTLETVRRWYGFLLIGYVVMPEHVHLLLSEPERENLALVPSPDSLTDAVPVGACSSTCTAVRCNPIF
jgi:putative transposase